MKSSFILGCMAMALAIATTSCSGDDSSVETTTSEEKATSPVAFSASAEWSEFSRAAAFEVFDKNDAIGVFAYHYPSTTGTPTQEYMVNQQVLFDGNDGWDYAPIKYWPADDNDKLSFIAYSPYCAEYAKTTDDTGTQYTVSYDLTANQDIMTASVAAKTYAESKGLASLQFDHKLTKISFKLVKGKTFPPGATVSNLTVANQHKQATLNITNQSLTVSDAEDNTTARALPGTAYAIEDANTAQTVADVLYLKPGQTQLPLTITVGSVTYSVTVSAPSSSTTETATFEAGKSYLLVLTFNGALDKFTVDIQKWTVAMSHKEDKYIIK